MTFDALGRILLVSSVCAIELSVWMGVCGCKCPISLSVCRMDTAILALMNSAPNSASVADDITAFIICEIFNTAPLLMGISSKPAMNSGRRLCCKLLVPRGRTHHCGLRVSCCLHGKLQWLRLARPHSPRNAGIFACFFLSVPLVQTQGR